MKHYLIDLFAWFMALLKTFLIGNKSLKPSPSQAAGGFVGGQRGHRNALQHFGNNYKLSLFF